jgi:hypothetical protein
LKKTSYELLTGNKPKVSYFRVFGCKFAPKVNESFLLGYGSNEHAYRVFNKTSGRVEIAVDMTFNESNGSQVEQVDASVVGKEDLPCEVIKQLSIDDIRPQEDEATDLVVPLVANEEVSTDVPNVEEEQTPAAVQQGGSATPPPGATASPTPIRGQNLQPIFEEEVENPEDDQEAIEHPRLKQTIQRDHPTDNILGSL